MDHTIHGVGLATTGLSISKDSAVITVEHVLDSLTTEEIVYVLLSTIRAEYVIKVVDLLLFRLHITLLIRRKDKTLGSCIIFFEFLKLPQYSFVQRKIYLLHRIHWSDSCDDLHVTRFHLVASKVLCKGAADAS